MKRIVLLCLLTTERLSLIYILKREYPKQKHSKLFVLSQIQSYHRNHSYKKFIKHNLWIFLPSKVEVLS